MKNIIFISIFCLLPFSAFTQKVSIEVIKVKNVALSEWQILNEKYMQVFSDKEYFRDDSVLLNLEANKRYFLQISVTEIYNPEANLYSVLINNEPVMLIRVEIEPGDYFYPFFTGIKTEQTKIIGGSDADIADFPWQVYYEAGENLCGGSIIGRNWVVTAAHCTKKSTGGAISASQMSVKAGATNPYYSSEGKKYFVSEVIVHENFNIQSLNYDIALLKLKEPIDYENARPIKLINSDNVAEGYTDPGVMGWITGWGLTKVRPEVLPDNLQKAQLPIVSNTQASVVWRSIPATDIMAGYLNGNKGACNGDSGGPLVVPVSDEYRLAGIASWGSEKCDTYGAYTRISDMETWIRTKTGIEDYKPPSPSGDTIICQGIETSHYSVQKLPEASDYEWQLLPENSGIITGNSENATVSWNLNYTGPIIVRLRVTINDEISEWSKLNIIVAKNTKLLSQSGDNVTCEEQPVILEVLAEGNNLSYEWYKYNSLIQLGPFNELKFLKALPFNSGEYKCKVSGLCGEVYSDIMKITVYPLTRISDISKDILADFGDNITLEIIAEGHDLVYQWYKNNELLENINTSGLMLQNINAADIGLYQSAVSGTCGTLISDTIYVYLKKDSESAEPGVLVWPTLTSDVFYVACSNDDYYTIRIFSVSGILIKELTKCRYLTEVEVNHWPRGIYFINIRSKNFNKSIKLIKE